MENKEFTQYIADYIQKWHKESFLPVGERMERFFAKVKEIYGDNGVVSPQLWEAHLRGAYLGGVFTLDCFGHAAKETESSSEKRLEIFAMSHGRIYLTVHNLEKDRYTDIFKGHWRELGEPDGAWECAHEIAISKAMEDPLFFYGLSQDLTDTLDKFEMMFPFSKFCS